MKRQLLAGCVLLIGVFGWQYWRGELTVTVGESIEHETVDELLTGELLVSPGARDEVTAVLREADYQLRIWDYTITYGEAIQLIQNLATIGVEVQIIAEPAVYGSEGNSFQEYADLVAELTPYGVGVTGDNQIVTNFMHAKVALIDDEAVIISTANLTYPSLRNNREYWFVSRDQGVIESLQYLFAQDWRGDPVDPTRLDPALSVCPIDCRADIVAALSGAQKSIWIATQYIEDEQIVRLLTTKAQELDVRLLVGRYQDQKRLAGFATGVKYLRSPYLHAKNILIDNELLIVGSTNLSTNALDQNREISIAVNDPSVIRTFRWQFDDDWAAGNRF